MLDRDYRIDFLRFIGLSLIIVAHVQSPFLLRQIRCFDVPLMLFVSGLTISGKNIDNVLFYIKSRTRRLIIPVWIFLIFYLSSLYVVQFFLLEKQYLTFEMIWRSFLLLDNSIGYVWIIRVFLVIMLITPLILEVNKKIKNNVGFILLLFFLLAIAHTLFMVVNVVESSFIIFILRDLLLYAVAYSVPFILGIRLKNILQKDENMVSVFIYVLSLFFMLCFFHYNGFYGEITPKYKDPPQGYYIVYGSMVSVLLWNTRNLWAKFCRIRIFVWIGQNTIWIYLWHMPLALIATKISDYWIIRYLFVYLGALIIFFIQYFIVKRTNRLFFIKYFLG